MKRFAGKESIQEFVNIVKSEFTTLDTKLTTSINTVSSSLTSHKDNKSNPHSVTCSQIGAAVSGHTHDDRYYTESEINTKLSGKSDTSHTHDDRYYTETEINTKLGTKADQNLIGATTGFGGTTNIKYSVPDMTNKSKTVHTSVDNIINAIKDSTDSISDQVLKSFDLFASKDHSHTLSLASATSRGGVKIGYTPNDWKVPVELSSDEKMFVDIEHFHSTILDYYNQSQEVKMAYSKNGLDYGDYSWLAGWNGYELRAINKNQFAQASHSHSGYASSDHTHSGYAASDHTHSGYASSTHTHSGYYNGNEDSIKSLIASALLESSKSRIVISRTQTCPVPSSQIYGQYSSDKLDKYVNDGGNSYHYERADKPLYLTFLVYYEDTGSSTNTNLQYCSIKWITYGGNSNGYSWKSPTLGSWKSDSITSSNIDLDFSTAFDKDENVDSISVYCTGNYRMMWPLWICIELTGMYGDTHGL